MILLHVAFAWLLLLIPLVESVKLHRFANARHTEKLLSLHSDPEDFVGATWIIFIDQAQKAYMDPDVMSDELNRRLAQDHCEILESAIGKHQWTYKVYCNSTAMSGKVKLENYAASALPTLLMPHAFTDYLYKHFTKSQIHMEQNKLMRRPSHQLFYGTSELLQYAYKYDAGQVGHDYRDAEIKMPHEEVYRRIHEMNFVENTAPWALDRIDQRTGSLDNLYQYIDTASDVDVYVIDSGIRISHHEFQGRASFLINTVGDSINTDCVGHGTFVASEIGGATYGVAKSVHLYAVKVLDCSGDGDLFSIQAGITQVIETSQTNTSRRGVVNLSLGGSKSSLLDNAVISLVTAGLVVSVSAGNSGADACNYSPADLGGTPSAHVMTVSASDIHDDRPSWANTGSCVTISAPGANVAGAWYTSDSATNTLSGTSMAAPLVAGVAALMLEQDMTLSVPDVKNLILAWATPNIIDFTSSAGGGRNLLFSLIVPSALPPPTSAPPPHAPTFSFEDAGEHVTCSILLTFGVMLLALIL